MLQRRPLVTFFLSLMTLVIAISVTAAVPVAATGELTRPVSIVGPVTLAPGTSVATANKTVLLAHGESAGCSPCTYIIFADGLDVSDYAHVQLVTTLTGGTPATTDSIVCAARFPIFDPNFNGVPYVQRAVSSTSERSILISLDTPPPLITCDYFDGTGNRVPPFNWAIWGRP